MKKLTIKDTVEMINALAARIEDLESINFALESKVQKLETKRGPESLRKMDEKDARRIMLGDLKDLSHKKAAEELGLSYGQIYSCRGGYTFKNIMEEKLKADKEDKE